MNHARHIRLATTLLALALSEFATAADPTNSGSQGKATLCISCHGARGEGNPAMASPRLAGQWSEYLRKQLNAFADGTRASPVMTPIAKGLDSQARNELAAYYSTLTAPTARPASSTAAEANTRGSQLATNGDGDRRIQACANCHGPGGSGEPPAFPYLAGQPESYLLSSLRSWRDGTRKTDVTQQMPAIARKLSEDDLPTLARYYASLPSPPPYVPMKRAKPVGTAQPSRGPEQTPATQGASGPGSEQGAGVTGGGQGPGGGGGTKLEQK